MIKRKSVATSGAGLLGDLRSVSLGLLLSFDVLFNEDAVLSNVAGLSWRPPRGDTFWGTSEELLLVFLKSEYLSVMNYDSHVVSNCIGIWKRTPQNSSNKYRQ